MRPAADRGTAPPPTEPPRPTAQYGRGLVLFPPGTPPARRRRRLVFAAVLAAVAASLVWPLFPLAAARLPPLGGLPGPFAWVVAALAVCFAALVAVYRGDRGDGGDGADGGDRGDRRGEG